MTIDEIIAEATPRPWEWAEIPSDHTLDNAADAPDLVWDGITRKGSRPDFCVLRSSVTKEPVISGAWCNDGTADIAVSWDNAAYILLAVNSYERQRECIQKLNAALTELMECTANGSPLPILTKAMVFGSSALARAKELLTEPDCAVPR